MYQDYLFVITHLGARVRELQLLLESSSGVSVNTIPLSYNSPADLDSLSNMCHARRPFPRICCDMLAYNHSIRNKLFYERCKFLYYFDEPGVSFNILTHQLGYKSQQAVDYYTFRLQRISHLFQQTDKKYIMHWKDVPNPEAASSLAKFLKLKRLMPVELYEARRVAPSVVYQVFDKYWKKIIKNYS